MFIVYLEQKQHTVRRLAAAIDVSKSVITSYIDTLSILGLVKRVRDEKDKRNIFITGTVKGAVFLTDFAAMIEKSNKETRET